MNKRVFESRIFVVVIIFFFIMLGGAIGYVFIENYTFLEGLYMTLITLTTIGFGEVRPLTEKGRMFTMFLIVVGVAFVASQLSHFGEFVADGKLFQVYRRKKVRKKLEKMEDHYIICGYGQMGKIIVSELQKNNFPLVVIEKDNQECVKLEESRIPYIEGDSTEEEVLIEAGILKAKGLVAAVSKDTDNVFIVLTARDLNRNLFISARASSAGAEKRLKKAGADRIVSPYASGALRIAHNIIRPAVTDFLELALSGDGMELSMEEVKLMKGSPLVGKNLINSNIRSSFNLIIVAIKRVNGQMIYNPVPSEVLEEGDTLIAIGPKNNLNDFLKAV